MPVEHRRAAAHRLRQDDPGHVDEAPQPRDFFTTELLGEPLLVVRDLEGEVRVLSNVCRHRGNLVAQGKGNATRFICQYHAWTYRTDGSLLRAPLMDEVASFDPKGCALPRLATEVWNHFIFVNLDGTAQPLAPQLEGLSAIIRNYHHELRNLLYTGEDVWDTNWKNLAENFIEGYHLSATHRHTLHPTTPTKLCKKLPGEAQYTGYRSYYDPSVPDRGPYHEDLTEDERRNSVMGCIYPCFLFGVATHYTLYMTLRPAGVSRGLINHYFATKDDLLVEVYRGSLYQTVSTRIAHLSRPGPAADDTPEARLGAIIEATFTPEFFSRASLRVWLALWGEIASNATLRAAHRQLYGTYRRAIAGEIGSIAEARGIALDADRLAGSFLALIDGLWLEWCLDDTAVRPDETRAAALAMLEAHLGTLANA